MTRRVLFSVLLALAACTRANLSSVEVNGRAAPTDTTTCKFSGTGDKLLGPGTMDVSTQYTGFPGYLSYGIFVYVKNNVADPTLTSSAAVTNSKSWRALNAKVRVNPSSFSDQFGTASPALLQPACGSCDESIALDGQGVRPAEQQAQFLPVVTPALGSFLASAVVAGDPKRIVLGITLQGVTLDGEKVDSGEWFFPIDVCDGCLPIPACKPGDVLAARNCIGFGQDNSPVCVTPAGG